MLEWNSKAPSFWACLAACLTMLFALDAAADSLFGADGQVRPEFLDRCKGTATIDPQRCANLRGIARNTGCLSDPELAAAARLGLSVVCAPDEPSRIYTACPCSCFQAGTQIWTFDAASGAGTRNVEDLMPGDAVSAMGEDVRLPEVSLQPHQVLYSTHGPESEDLFRIHVEGGGPSVTVTQHHALLLDSGRITTAKRLRVGDMLVHASGSPLKVAHITRSQPREDVYNFLVDAPQLAGHLVVAEGIIVGDLLWQNSLDRDVAAVSLR